ncbi:osomolarity two-component system- sensor histidine kinase SLN1 [Apiospora arundinis]|uniref:Osmosensing histidine protein kinase SLN1 n=1 Tax=Apiospora arundinis TaxID=335852 RepID=A0ABR2JAW2_9PEZI
MRIAIREQLAALVLSAVLCALAIVAIPTWIYVNNFVNNVEKDSLSLTASLKAAQVSSEIELIQTTCRTISTRLLIQNALKEYYLGNDSAANWRLAASDLLSALTSGDQASTSKANLLQARLYSRNDTGKSDTGLFSITAETTDRIKLPYKAPNGSDIYLGDDGLGYPAALYPNISYYPDNTRQDPLWPSVSLPIARPFPEVRIDAGADGLIFGPLVLSVDYALMSLTLPIRQNSNSTNILGYMTMVAEASSLISIMKSREGLGETGSVLIIGPDSGWNRFNKYNLPATPTQPPAKNFSDVDVRFVLPPIPPPGIAERHPDHNFASGNFRESFSVKSYPVVLSAFTEHNKAVNNASAVLSTHNEEDIDVAVGYARPQTSLVNWTLVVEKEKSEAYRPVNTLRKILLGCVFGTVGVIILLIVPCAHLSVQPIRRLKSATEKSVAPPGYGSMDEFEFDEDDPDMPPSTGHSNRSKRGFFGTLRRKFRRRRHNRASPSVPDSDPRRRVFKIPGRVHDRKHWITDELTELTTVFNDMGDELLKQYTSLDQKVAERTSELEISKKAAEAANESKTLFIANISHELKTPLNGILGMCAVCMEEDDILRIKQSLKTLYKSGDLLLHLLEDLLSFSKNQIGQQLSLEEKEFRLGDIRSQVLTIFDKQVREGKIVFSVDFLSTDMDPGRSPERASTEIIDPKLPAIGPLGTGRLKDMCLWGDQHRILQVIINLVSNSLKFTPAGGNVRVRIRCVGEIEQRQDESRTSSFSKGSGRAGRSRHRMGSGSNHSASSKGQGNSQHYKGGTALAINPMDPKATPHVHVRERSPTPPPSNAKSYMFEFEVEDTGPGIPEHMQQRVFEPFVQGDLGLSKKFGGTGLGLSICQQLANLMGGNIDLRSTVGTGTTFTMHIPLKYTKDRPSSTASSSMKSRAPSVTSADGENQRNSLPAKAAATKTTTAEAKATVLDQQPRLVGLSQPFFAAHPQPAPKPSAEEHLKAIDRAMANKPGQKLRVLVADDNSTNIEVVSRMLKLEDIYDVTIAKDGQEAYDLVKADMDKNLKFDVIFMDIQMPNLDGLQSTRLIRKMGYSAPIVALTAFSEESNVKECMESGMDEFLAKPIRRPALKQVLKRFATIPEEPETASVKSKTPSPTAERTPIPVPSSQPIPESKEKPEHKENEIMMNGNTPHLPTNGITTNGL